MFNNSRFKKLALGSSLVFLTIVAVTLGSSQIYLMAIILGLVPIVLWLMGLAFTKGIASERNAPETCHEGERVRVNVTVTNTGLLPKFYIRATDRLPRWIRFAGDDREQGSMVLTLWPGESAMLGYYIEPLRRGLFQIGPTRIRMSDLVGFSSATREMGAPSEVLVYPQVLPVRADFLSSGISRGWREEDRALTRGSGMDFDGVREYRSGDELRRINWKATARVGRLAVTEYTQGEANDVIIALDLAKAGYQAAGADGGAAFEQGIKIAAALAAAALRQGSSMQLLTAANVAEARDPLRGLEHLPVVLDELARAEAEYETSLAQVLERAAGHTRRGTTLVCITAHSPEDHALRAALTTWRSAPVSSTLSLFWLQTGTRAVDEGGRIADAGAIETLAGAGRTTLGAREYFVTPSTNLMELLQEPSYARFGS